MKENMKKEIIKRVLSSLLAFVLIFSELSGVIPAYASADAGVQEQAIYQAEETPEADETFQAEEVSEADETVQPEQTPEASEGEEVSETDETVQAEETPEASEIAAADEDYGEEPVEDGDEDIMLLSDGENDSDASGPINLSIHAGETIYLTGNGGYEYGDTSTSCGSQAYTFTAESSINSEVELVIGKPSGTAVTDLIATFDGVAMGDKLNITVSDGCSAELRMKGGCTMGRITLGKNAELTLSSSDAGTLSFSSADRSDSAKADASSTDKITFSNLVAEVSGSINAATVSINGGTIKGSADTELAAKYLIVSNATIATADNGNIDAVKVTDSMSLTNSYVKADSIGAYAADSARHEAEISITGGTLSCNNLGALDDSTVTKCSSLSATLNGSPEQKWDYSLSYYNFSDGDAKGYTKLDDAGADAPAYYRTENGSAITGWFNKDSTLQSGNADGLNTAISAVTASRSKYEFRCWSLDQMADSADEASDMTNEAWLTYDSKEYDSDNKTIDEDSTGTKGYTAATVAANSGNVSLYAIYVPESAVVSVHSNYGTDTVYAAFPAYVGAVGIDLSVYLDKGTYAVLVREGYTASTLSHTDDGESVSLNSFVLADKANSSLYVIWTTRTTGLNYSFETYYENQTFEYKDSDGNWHELSGSNLAELIASLQTAFPMTSCNFGEKYPALPELRATAINDNTPDLQFDGWRVSKSADDGSYIYVNADSVLDESTMTSEEISKSSQTVYAVFKNKKYDLTVSTAHAGWTYYDSYGKEITFTANGDDTSTAKVESLKNVYLVRSDESTVEPYWTIIRNDDNTRIFPQESNAAKTLGSADKDAWLVYVFEMPKSNVKGVYNTNVQLDTADGDYVFGTYSINGHESYGYQVQNPADSSVLRTQRWIMKSNKVTAHFTSSAPTSNRIVTDASTTLYLHGVRLTERKDVVSQLSSFYSSGIYNSNPVDGQYCDSVNILINNSPETTHSYNINHCFPLNIVVEEDSSVFAIAPKKWMNSIYYQLQESYSNQISINTNGKALSFYSLLACCNADNVINGGGTVNALTTGDTAADTKIHWIHYISSSSQIYNVTLNCEGRDLYSKCGGSISAGGNGVHFYLGLNKQPITVNNAGTIWVPFLDAVEATIQAKNIFAISYGFIIKNSTINAEIMGFNGTVHTGYSNDDNYLDNSTVTISNWMSTHRLRIRNNSALTVANGLHLYESLSVFGNSNVSVGSLQPFKTYNGNTAHDGKVYNDANSLHQFYADIYGGSHFTVTGNGVTVGENSVNWGVVHESANPQIKIYGTGTVMDITGNANVIDTLTVKDGASLKVNGDLTVHEGLAVQGSGTSLDVTGNLKYVTTATYPKYGSSSISYKDLACQKDSVTEEDKYWIIDLDKDATVNVGGGLVSGSADDRTNVIYTRGNASTAITGDVYRDVQVTYTVPSGFENAAANPGNIRLINDVADASLTLSVPDKTDPSNPLVLTSDCWADEDSINVTGWSTSALTGANMTAFASPIQTLKLNAVPTSYLLNLVKDPQDASDDTIQNIDTVEYSIDDGATWTNVDIREQMSIPVNAKVRVTVLDGFEDLCCAEILSGTKYTPVEISGNGKTRTFTMSDVQIYLTVAREKTLYLNEYNIYVQNESGKAGFAHYDGSSFVPYGGNLIITQSDLSDRCDYTLFVQRDVAADEKTVTVTGINVTKNDGTEVDTIDIKSGVTASLHLKGANSIRNIENPKGAVLTLIGADDADTTFVKNNYMSSSAGTAADDKRYRMLIGASGGYPNSSGTLTIKGGKYTSDAGNLYYFGSWDNILIEDADISFSCSESCLAINAPAVTFRGTSLTLNSTVRGIVATDFLAEDSASRATNITLGTITATTRRSALQDVTGTAVLKGNTQINEAQTITHNNNKRYFVNKTLALTLQDNAAFNTISDMIVKSLTVKDNASLTAMESESDSWGSLIAAPSISISDSANVKCGWLLCSGYSDTLVNSAELISKYQNNTYTRNGTIDISGGNVSAVGGSMKVYSVSNASGVETPICGMIGGAGASTINLAGGAVDAGKIGSTDYIMGSYYTVNSAVANEKENTAAVNLTDSTLTNFEKLGGTNDIVTIDNASLTVPADAQIGGSSITISGTSAVAMSSGSVIGCDDSAIVIRDSAAVTDNAGALGAIAAHNGSLTVQDNASVHVNRIDMTGGTATVSTLNKKLVSSYDYDCGVPEGQVGVFVDYGGGAAPGGEPGTQNGDFVADTLTIASDSCVSAYRIGSNAASGETGDVTFEKDSHIYTHSYGKLGAGAVNFKDNGAIIEGERQVAINYLNASGAIFPDSSVYSYEFKSASDTEVVTLPVIYKYGYRFDGWSYNEDYNKNEIITTIAKSRSFESNLYAHWTPVKIWLCYDLGEDQNPRYNWQAITFGETDVIYDSPEKTGYFGSGHVADSDWSAVYGTTQVTTQTNYTVPMNLYDEYLRVNGIEYDAEGKLSDEELVKLAVLEKLNTEENALAGFNASSYKPVKFTTFWAQSTVDVAYDACDKAVTSYKYGDTVRYITRQGTGTETITMFVATPYTQVTVGGDKLDAIPVPLRTGYTFNFWKTEDGTFKLYSNGTATGEEITAENPVLKVLAKVTELKADYTAKNYTIEVDKTHIFVGDEQKDVKTTCGKNSISATFDAAVGDDVLPEKAVCNGYIFEGWNLVDSEGKILKKNISADTIFKWDYENMKLVPVMRHTTISYVMNGGSWTTNDQTVIDGYAQYVTDALPTVVYTHNTSPETWTIAAGATNELVRHGYRFIGWVLKDNYDAWQNAVESASTEAQKTDAEAKNYFGTADSQGPHYSELIQNAAVTDADVSYYAVWQRCTYKVILHAWNTEAELSGTGTVTTSTSGDVTTTTVNQITGIAGKAVITSNYKTGDLITSLTVEDDITSIQLPSMDSSNRILSYYKDGTNLTSTRQLVGWMFSDVNPITSYYNSDGSIKSDYAETVTSQMNLGQYYMPGDNFTLPEGITDNGDGTTLDLYAVYRERSLIFVDVRPDGTETVKKISDYNVDRSGYIEAPATEEAPENYVMTGWYVNSKKPETSRDYTWYGLESTNNSKNNEYYYNQDGAYVYRKGVSSGTYLVNKYLTESDAAKYDIYVYSYYAPIIDLDLTAYAQAGMNIIPTGKVTIPETLKVDTGASGTANIKYTVDASLNEGVKLVSKDIIDKMVKDGGEQVTIDGVTYDANKTFAVELKSYNAVGTQSASLSAKYLTVNSTPTPDNMYLTGGYKLEAVVYSTKRLDGTEKLGTITVSITFDKLPNAELTLNIALRRQTAVYEINLDANVPTSTTESFSDITGWNTVKDQARSSLIDTMYRSFNYGDAATVLPKLSLKGYTFNGWYTAKTCNENEKVSDKLNYIPADSTNLAGTLYAGWTRNTNNFTVDQAMIDNYTITYNDGTGAKTVSAAGVVQIPYKASVQLAVKSGKETNKYKEFITSTGAALDGAETGGSYTFTMPDNDVSLTFNRVKTLDIADGSIAVANDSYTQNGGTAVTWHGDYVFTGSSDSNSIAVNAGNGSTEENVTHSYTLQALKTTGESVTVGSGVASIDMIVSGTNTVKNINCSGSTALTVNGSAGAVLNCLPDAGEAGIQSEGKVTLNDLTVNASVTKSSGQSGNVTSSAVKSSTGIELNNTGLTATAASPVAYYAGVVLDAPSVDLKSGSSVCTKQENTGCPVSSAAKLTADNTVLTLDGSQITGFLGINSASGMVTLEHISVINLIGISGVESGVKAATITVENNSEIAVPGDYVSGNQTIGINADVNDKRGRHLDVKSGDITITADGYTQFGSVIDRRSETETKAYVLVGGVNDSCKVNADNPTGTLYSDGVTIRSLTVSGETKLSLLSNSTIKDGITENSGKTGTLTITSDDSKLRLTSGGDINVLNLTADNIEISASGKKVGSSGTGAGFVTIKNADITADTIGAIGAQSKAGDNSQNYTGVTLEGTNRLSGTLVQDLYRLNYSAVPNYSNSTLPATLRKTTVYTDGTAGTPEYFPVNGLPDDPTANAGLADSQKTFLFWYITETEGDTVVNNALKTAKQEGFDGGYTNLKDNTITTAAASSVTTNADGTKTLQIYSNLKMQGTCAITSGKRLDGFTGSETSATVYTNSAWTADFTVKGALIEGSSYQLAFGQNQKLPANTMLTLVVEGATDQAFYYKANGTETTVSLSDFIKMGTTDQKPELLSGEAASTINDHFTLVADFSQASAAESSGVAVKLQLVTGTGNAATVSDVGTQNLTYTLTARPASTITATGATVNVNVANDTELSGKKLYLLAQINNSGFTAPYTSTAKVVNGGSEIAGTWLGGNMLSFNLGNYEAGVKSYTYTISGLDTGSYDITWKICYGSASDTNTANHVLATSSAVTYAATKALPWLKVAVGDSNQKIAVNTAKVFTVTTDDGETVTAKVYKLSGSSKYTSAGSSATITGSGNTFTVTCSEAGTYRVEFSIKDSCMYDNVYYSFVVE